MMTETNMKRKKWLAEPYLKRVFQGMQAVQFLSMI
jgi:hypothetical protein